MNRSLPTFVIAGAMRSGTTALSNWLGGHPDVFMASVKEVHYFDRHYDEGPGWYLRHFEGHRDAAAVGEATPNYLYDPVALRRMAADLPQAQVLILLRNPVDRAYSHFLHRVSRGTEDLTFDEAVRAEPERLADGDALTRAHYSYVDRGRYLAQLQHLYEVYPREQVSIHLYEDLRDSPVQVFRDVATFLGVDPAVLPEGIGRRINAFQQFRSLRVQRLTSRLPRRAGRLIGRLNRVDASEYPEMPEAARRELRAVYEPERAELEQLLGRSLASWA